MTQFVMVDNHRTRYWLIMQIKKYKTLFLFLSSRSANIYTFNLYFDLLVFFINCEYFEIIKNVFFFL